jgi:hypothetical protein
MEMTMEQTQTLSEARVAMRMAELDRIIYPNGGNYLWGALAGDHNSTKRQSVMQFVYGEKFPKSKCGWNAVMNTLGKYFGIADLGDAAIEDHVNACCRSSRK